jgi:hypothetical protein
MTYDDFDTGLDDEDDGFDDTLEELMQFPAAPEIEEPEVVKTAWWEWPFVLLFVPVVAAWRLFLLGCRRCGEGLRWRGRAALAPFRWAGRGARWGARAFRRGLKAGVRAYGAVAHAVKRGARAAVRPVVASAFDRCRAASSEYRSAADSRTGAANREASAMLRACLTPPRFRSPR